ncbi:unnamed protein product, partial [Tuber aestivum]
TQLPRKCREGYETGITYVVLPSQNVGGLFLLRNTPPHAPHPRSPAITVPIPVHPISASDIVRGPSGIGLPCSIGAPLETFPKKDISSPEAEERGLRFQVYKTRRFTRTRFQRAHSCILVTEPQESLGILTTKSHSRGAELIHLSPVRDNGSRIGMNN